MRPDALGTSKRVLVVAPTPFFADRGCHVRIYEQCRALRRAGHEVTICTYHVGRDVDDMEIRRSPRVPWYRRLSAGPSVHKMYIDVLLLGTVVRQCLRKRPDVIHAHLHEGVLIGRVAAGMFGVPLVADLQGSLAGELVQHGFVRNGSGLHRMFAAAERMIASMPQMVLASSQGTLASLLGCGEGARVLPDGIDTDEFFPDAEGGELVRERLGIGARTRVVGYLGVLTDYQGIPVLLRAAQRVLRHVYPRPHFLVMGYPDEERYRAMAVELGIGADVTFTGRVAYDEARAYLSACDAAVSPKVSLTEANGKLLNYLAVGLPIVASETPINREILGDAGILTPAGDDRAMAEALIHVLSDQRAAGELSRRALRRAEAFSWSTLGEELAALYSEAGGAAQAAEAPQAVHT
jgi:glycosyltransferase involved in cell wall biosynthesis